MFSIFKRTPKPLPAPCATAMRISDAALKAFDVGGRVSPTLDANLHHKYPRATSATQAGADLATKFSHTL
jgi:hypothetical protein